MNKVLTTLLTLLIFGLSAHATSWTKSVPLSYQCSFIMDGFLRHLIVTDKGAAFVTNPKDINDNKGIEQTGWIGLVDIFPSGPGEFSRHISALSPNRLAHLDIDTPFSCYADFGKVSKCDQLMIKNVAVGYGNISQRPVLEEFNGASCMNYSRLKQQQLPQYQITTDFTGTVMALGLDGWEKSP